MHWSAVRVSPRFRKPDPVRVELLSDGLNAVSIAVAAHDAEVTVSDESEDVGWFPVSALRVDVPLEMKRDCRMAGRACTEGAGQLSVRVWGRWGRPKHRPAIIRSSAAA